MTRPHEEMWSIAIPFGTICVFDNEKNRPTAMVALPPSSRQNVLPTSEAEMKRLVLAHMAPAMARVLLDIIDRAENGPNDLGDCLGQKIRHAIVDVLLDADVPLPKLTGDWAEHAARPVADT